MVQRRKTCLIIMCACLFLAAGCGVKERTYRLSEMEPQENVSSNDVEPQNFSNENMEHYFQISDRYDNGDNISFEKFKKDAEGYKKLYTFFNDLKAEGLCMELYEQPLQYVGYWKGGVKYISDEAEEMLNQKVPENGGIEYYSTMKTIQIGEDLNEQLTDEIVEERAFEKSDFEYQNHHKIPVILGAEYKNKYQVGSSIKMFLISEIFDCEVIGFFKEGSRFYENGYVCDLDYYICMPLFQVTDITTCDLSKEFLFSYYLEKCYCYIRYDSEKEKAEKAEKVRALAEKNGLVFDANEADYEGFYFYRKD